MREMFCRVGDRKSYVQFIQDARGAEVSKSDDKDRRVTCAVHNDTTSLTSFITCQIRFPVTFTDTQIATADYYEQRTRKLCVGGAALPFNLTFFKNKTTFTDHESSPMLTVICSVFFSCYRCPQNVATPPPHLIKDFLPWLMKEIKV